MSDKRERSFRSKAGVSILKSGTVESDEPLAFLKRPEGEHDNSVMRRFA
jgi:hypothetical protein